MTRGRYDEDEFNPYNSRRSHQQSRPSRPSSGGTYPGTAFAPRPNYPALETAFSRLDINDGPVLPEYYPQTRGHSNPSFPRPSSVQRPREPLMVPPPYEAAQSLHSAPACHLFWPAPTTYSPQSGGYGQSMTAGETSRYTMNYDHRHRRPRSTRRPFTPDQHFPSNDYFDQDEEDTMAVTRLVRSRSRSRHRSSDNSRRSSQRRQHGQSVVRTVVRAGGSSVPQITRRQEERSRSRSRPPSNARPRRQTEIQGSGGQGPRSFTLQGPCRITHTSSGDIHFDLDGQNVVNITVTSSAEERGRAAFNQPPVGEMALVDARGGADTEQQTRRRRSDRTIRTQRHTATSASRRVSSYEQGGGQHARREPIPSPYLVTPRDDSSEDQDSLRPQIGPHPRDTREYY